MNHPSADTRPGAPSELPPPETICLGASLSLEEALATLIARLEPTGEPARE